MEIGDFAKEGPAEWSPGPTDQGERIIMGMFGRTGRNQKPYLLEDLHEQTGTRNQLQHGAQQAESNGIVVVLYMSTL